MNNQQAIERILRLGFDLTDTSWGNDAMDSVGIENANDELSVRISIDSENPSDSEFAEQRATGEYKRFSVCFGDDNGTEFQTDSIDELEAYFRGLVSVTDSESAKRFLDNLAKRSILFHPDNCPFDCLSGNNLTDRELALIQVNMMAASNIEWAGSGFADVYAYCLYLCR